MTLTVTATDLDPDLVSLTLDPATSPPDASFVIDYAISTPAYIRGTLNWTPGCDAARDYNFTFTATDRFFQEQKTVTITVNDVTPQQHITNTLAAVDALVANGTLNQGQGKSLTEKLDQALHSRNKGNGKDADEKLQAFVNEVNAFLNRPSFSATAVADLSNIQQTVAALLLCQAPAPLKFNSEFGRAVAEDYFKNWAIAGRVTQARIIDLSKDPKFKGKEAAALGVLKAFVFGFSNPGVYKNLFIQNAENWDRNTQGITLDDIIFYDQKSYVSQNAKIQLPAKALEERWLEMANKIKITDRKLFPPAQGLNPEAPSFTAVQQGLVGDCAFLSVTAGLVRQGPKPFQTRFKDLGMQGGIRKYEVSFGDLKNPTKITINEPTDTEIAMYASATSNGLWLSVFEKAYVQLMADQGADQFGWIAADRYGSLEFGQFLEKAMKLVTGHDATVIKLAKGGATDPVTALKQLDLARGNVLTNHPIIVIDTPKNDNFKGLPPPAPPTNVPPELPPGPHAFAVQTIDPKNAFVLQNPWGQPRQAMYWGGLIGGTPQTNLSFNNYIYPSFRFIAVEIVPK